MEAGPNLDWLLGGLAIAITLGGMLMLVSGVSGMNDEGKPTKK